MNSETRELIVVAHPDRLFELDWQKTDIEPDITLTHINNKPTIDTLRVPEISCFFSALRIPRRHYPTHSDIYNR
jgi:hypothetical protein